MLTDVLVKMNLRILILIFCYTKSSFGGFENENSVKWKRSTENLEEICGTSSVNPELDSNILNETVVISEQWPWMAILYNRTHSIGAGTIVSEKLIVTAARNFLDKEETVQREKRQLIFVVGLSGGINQNDGNLQIISISEIFLHPNWDSNIFTSYEANIALAILKTPIEFTKNVMPICLPSLDSLQYNGNGALAWRKAIENSSESFELKLAKLSALDRNTCIKRDNTFSFTMGASTFCTELSESGPCTGEGVGGGFAQKINNRWTLVGILSFSKPAPCGEKRHFGFTDVSKFTDWINMYMKDTSHVQNSLEIESGNDPTSESTKNLEEICGISSTNPELDINILNETIVISEQWPWMASLYNKTDFVCSGAIVSEKLIVTVARCILEKEATVQKQANQLVFVVGVSGGINQNDENLQVIQLSEILLHPNWDSSIFASYEANIALAILKTPIVFSKNVMPICLPSLDSLQYNVKGALTWWKAVENSNELVEMKMTKLSALDRNTCIKGDNTFTFAAGASTFCTEFSEKGPCKGGGGIAYAQKVNDRWTLMGIMSFTKIVPCGEKHNFFFTDVSKFTDWIKMYMRESSHVQDSSQIENDTILEQIKNLKEICGTSSVNPGLKSLISYGSIVTSEQWPWMGALYHGSNLICGGTIVSEKLIVTAAHCIKDKYETEERDASQLIFIVGKSDLTSHLEKNFQIISISEILVHPNWNSALTTYEADIALAILKTPIIFNKFIMPVCIPDPDSLQYNVSGAVAGWGATENSRESNILKLTKLAVVDRKICIKTDNFFTQVMSSSTFCTELSESGPCKGDSGGGYAQKVNDRWTLVGIVSFTISNTCKEKQHIGFTDVSKFSNWIFEHVTGTI